MASIDRSEVLRIAELAQLELSDEELERMTPELDSILGYVRQLEQLDLREVHPTSHVQLDRMPMRSDEVVASLPRDQVLEQAPRASAEGFAVPAFVDEG